MSRVLPPTLGTLGFLVAVYADHGLGAARLAVHAELLAGSGRTPAVGAVHGSVLFAEGTFVNLNLPKRVVDRRPEYEEAVVSARAGWEMPVHKKHWPSHDAGHKIADREFWFGVVVHRKGPHTAQVEVLLWSAVHAWPAPNCESGHRPARVSEESFSLVKMLRGTLQSVK